ncbi:uncharacterized protein [Acropora muricata]|uniref:uncharacterized protein n=1 Tax=Acropora muricata TaxID=159855 RepID=UPI0034E56D91
MENFTLSFDVPLVSQELVMAGGDQDPLEKTFNTADAEQYQHSVCHPDEPVLPNVDFLLGLDETIVPSMSAGLSIFADKENLPQEDSEHPERLWMLQKEIANSGELKYPTEIEITPENANNGHYLIKPTAPVTLETFIQMLRCLPWMKMYSFAEANALHWQLRQ